MSYTVGRAAQIARVTVRALHHYDAIGLLRPSARTEAGYRRYSAGDLERLGRILLYRELGFSLEQIAAILDDATVDPLDHLRRQRELLAGRIEQLQGMLARLEEIMEANKMGINLKAEEIFEVFGDADPTRYADEVEQRWGDTDAYAESRRRTARYGKADWLRMRAESEAITARFAAALARGHPATSPEATALAEAHREHINRWFYACNRQMHRGLADMYVADERFTATYDAVAPGLAGYIRDAIHANGE